MGGECSMDWEEEIYEYTEVLVGRQLRIHKRMWGKY